MKKKDVRLFPIDAYKLITSEGIDDDRSLDESGDQGYESLADLEEGAPRIFSDLGVRPVPPGITSEKVNLFDLLKNGVGNTDVDLTLVFGMVLEFILRFHSKDTIRFAWDPFHNSINAALVDQSGTCEKRRTQWVREAEQQHPLSTEQRNAYCFQKLFEFASGEVKPARDKLLPDRQLVAKEVERYLVHLEERGDLGRWVLSRNKGHMWYLKKWESPDVSPENQRRQISQRKVQRSDKEIEDALDIIPVPPVNPEDEAKRIERKERGEKTRSKPIFDYAAYLPSRIIAILELHDAPLHTSRIKDFIISCLSRGLDVEAYDKPLADFAPEREAFYGQAGPDDFRDLSLYGDTPLTPEELYLQAEDRALFGSDEERRAHKVNQWMNHPDMNEYRKQTLQLILEDPKWLKNQTAFAKRVGCVRNTLRANLKFLSELTGYQFIKDDED